jgi:hypothetical protein
MTTTKTDSESKNMTTLEKVESAVRQYGFSVLEKDGVVIVNNRKGELSALVKGGTVDQIYRGSKNMCGSLVRNDILNALKS